MKTLTVQEYVAQYYVFVTCITAITSVSFISCTQTTGDYTLQSAFHTLVANLCLVVGKLRKSSENVMYLLILEVKCQSDSESFK